MIVIVGAGLCGLGMAAHLVQAGRRDFVILEKADRVGGTWRDNTYPGCACDVPSHLYSLSVAPWAGWTRRYARAPEIQAYVESLVERFELGPHLELGTRFEGATWDEARGRWILQTSRGEREARVWVAAAGALHRPAFPVPEREAFEGPQWHTARWRHDVDLAGKRVAVVGTGASAVQVVPELVDAGAQITLFQRTAPWVLPRRDSPIPVGRRRAYARVPGLREAHRLWTYLGHESRHAFFAGRFPQVGQRYAERQLAQAVPDPALRARLRPDFALGCKRVILSDRWYPALQGGAVELVDEGVEAVTPAGLRTASGAHAVDAIVWATGFQVARTLPLHRVVGRGGRSLAEVWSEDPGAFLGCTVHGFPNHVQLLGPNSGLGHTSVLVMAEAQMRHVVRLLGSLGTDETFEVRADRQRAFAEAVQADSTASVWLSGCRSWYLDRAGRNVTLWPRTTLAFLAEARRAGRRDYVCAAPD